MSPFHIVLVEPRIPQNTGNIGRICVGGGAVLHLIKPLGFHLTQKEIKRAGLDYWQFLEYYTWDSLEDFWKHYPIDTKHFFLTTKAKKLHYDGNFSKGAFLYFGREDRGLPPYLLNAHTESCLRIPMRELARSLNLSVSVGIALYEAIRQYQSPLNHLK